EWHRVQAMRGIGGKVEDRGNVVLVLNPDLPAKGFNFACKVDAGDTSKEQVIDYVVETFRSKGLVPHFQLWSITRPSDFSVDLWQRGFQEDRELDVMTWKKPTNVQPPQNVRVRTIGGNADMAAAVEIVLLGFDFPLEWKAVLLSSLDQDAEEVQGQTFLGEVDGRPAAVASLVRTGDKISGIYSVATLPEFRRRGLATALSLRCIEAYRDTGDEVLALQVVHGSDAQRLYERLGFETAYTLTLHTLP
ncbi:MAG TPA: GNAT family N-acetyltransferase, partial [Thermoplasmata archaeon]|nr:GNAT family N-acetyltransferase [Thermoplasmata archaeon]